MKQRTTRIGIWIGILTAALAAPVAAQDWPSWRGPEQNGVSRITGLPGTFEVDGDKTNLIWSQPLGARSAPVSHGGRVFLLHLVGEGKTQQEELVCLEGATGEILWRHAFNVFLTDIPSTRVGWANPAVDPQTGNVYVHGVQGLMICLSRDGEKIWERSLTEEFGRISGYGGRTHTPVIDEDRVVISFLNSAWGNQSRGTHRYLALDKITGEVVWWSEPAGAPLDTTYSTPVVAVVDGERLLIAGNADGAIYALRSRTGESVWSFKLSKRGINSSVVVEDGLVYACHSEENIDTAVLGRIVCFRASGSGDITRTNEVWRAEGITAGYSSPALHEGRLYVIDNSANIHCFDAKTGKQHWEHHVGTVMKASPVIADGKLYVGEVSGHFTIVELDDDEPKTICDQAFYLPDGRPREINGSPCIADGRVYFTTFTDMYCIGLPNREPSAVETPALAAEAPTPADAKPAHLQIVPGEVALTPGQSRVFTARLFDDKGRFLRECPATWQLKGVQATVSPEGRLTVPADSGFQGGLLAASAEGLTANARVRVVPSLPIEIDFEDLAVGATPSGWVGATGVKFKVVEIDGTRALSKLSDQPRFILANAYIGLPTSTGYTLRSDVRMTEKRFQLPNVGLIGNRYELTLMGNEQTLRLLSWVPMPRVKEDVDFEIEPDTWYTIVLRVDLRGADALVRGKVWKRDQAEPEAWTVELVDPSPNLSGAPGIQGYSAGATDQAAGADIYWDNIRITPNQ